MLIFSFSTGPRGGVQFSPLLLLLMVLMDPSWLQAFAALLQWLTGPLLWADNSSSSNSASRASGRAHQHSAGAATSSFAFGLARGFVLTMAAYFVGKALFWARRYGGWRGVLRALLLGGRIPNAGRRPTAQGGSQRGQAAQPRATLEQVAEALHKLPTELHATEQELAAMTVHELKARLEARHVDCSQFLEKQELMSRLQQCGGSTVSSCSICCDDFESGDPVRILPCQHRYHIDCIDKWLLSATDYSRPPACPLCNAEVLKGLTLHTQQPARPAASATGRL